MEVLPVRKAAAGANNKLIKIITTQDKKVPKSKHTTTLSLERKYPHYIVSILKIQPYSKIRQPIGASRMQQLEPRTMFHLNTHFKNK